MEKSPKNQNKRINFKDSLQDNNIGSILILTGPKITLLQGSLNFQRDISKKYSRSNQ